MDKRCIFFGTQRQSKQKISPKKFSGIVINYYILSPCFQVGISGTTVY